jgi:hypothetical protein
VNNASEVEMYFEVATYFEWNRQVPILRPVQFPQGTGTEVDDEMIFGNPGPHLSHDFLHAGTFGGFARCSRPSPNSKET